MSMNTTESGNKSILDSSELLTDFVNIYNLEQQESEENARQLDLAQETVAKQTSEILTLIQQNNRQAKDLIEASKGIANGEKIEKLYQKQKSELTLLRKQLAATQQELTTANNNGIAKKQKIQIKRIKAASELKDSKIKTLTTKVNGLTNDLAQANDDKVACKKIVEMLKNEQENNQAQGLYHNGDHHLVIWPQKANMLRPDGSEYQGTNLLYLHQSGRAAFITFDPENNTSELCPQPKGGLRPSSEVKEFAHNWLFKINQLQQGEIKDEDRTPINYND